MSVTVFDNHADDDDLNIAAGHLSTHTVTCRTKGCPRKGVPIRVPLPGHVEAGARGRPKLREVVYCGACQQQIVWSEVRSITKG